MSSGYIDTKRAIPNIYCDCYQRFSTMVERKIEDNLSFEEIELDFYKGHYGNYIEKQNGNILNRNIPINTKNQMLKLNIKTIN